MGIGQCAYWGACNWTHVRTRVLDGDSRIHTSVLSYVYTTLIYIVCSGLSSSPLLKWHASHHVLTLLGLGIYIRLTPLFLSFRCLPLLVHHLPRCHKRASVCAWHSFHSSWCACDSDLIWHRDYQCDRRVLWPSTSVQCDV